MTQKAFRQLIAPLGVTVELIADTPALLAAAVGCLPDSPGARPASTLPIRIRLETANAPSTDMSCAIRVEGSRLRLTGPDFDGFADACEKTASCSVPPRMMGDPAALAASILEPLALFLLTRSGRTPVHAAGLAVKDTAVLLCGPSGSGKSSLALAGARRGLPVLSEDTVYVQLDPRMRVWGWPGPIHVAPAAAGGPVHPIRVRGGKRKAAVPVPAGQGRMSCDEAVVLLLERGEHAALTPITADEATPRLMQLEAGFDLLPRQSAAAAEALTRNRPWKLTLSPDPEEAIDLLLAELPLR